jgi:hypothetical protein
MMSPQTTLDRMAAEVGRRRWPWRILSAPKARRERRKALAGQAAAADTVPGRHGSVVDGVWHPPIG